MPKPKRPEPPPPHRPPRLFQLGPEWYLVADHDDEGLHALRLTGPDRDEAIRMTTETHLDIEAALTQRR
jgi:hypothetical protein